MHNVPPIDLAVRISKIINRNRDQLKAYHDKNGRVSFNLLIGFLLGGICSFADKPMLNQILGIFFPVFNDKQLKDYADLMMGLNNYLVSMLDENPNNLYLLENNKWILIADAQFDTVYALWHAFFGIMKVEFEQETSKIEKLKANNVTTDALNAYSTMHKIMTAPALSNDDINVMYDKFPQYAHQFNELRKLMYMQIVTPEPTVH